MKRKDIILIGGGGHCRSVIDVIESGQEYRIAGIVDRPEKAGASVSGYPVVGDDQDLPELARTYRHFLIAIGQIRSSEIRAKQFELLKKLNITLAVIVAHGAYRSGNCSLGEGTVVMHGAFINAGTKIGRNCIINTGAVVEHDAVIGDHCHISTGAVVNGACSVAEGSFIGSNAVIAHSVSVGAGCVVGAGSVVIRDVPAEQVVAGNPAKPLS